MQIEAYHIPSLEDGMVEGWEVREYDGGAVRLRFPRLTPAGIRQIARRLRVAQKRFLADRPVAEIIQAIDKAAALLQDPDHPTRIMAERALPAITGYSPAMITLVLDRMIAEWRGAVLEELLRRELGDPALLDGFQSVGGVRVRAYGPGLVYHIFAGNIPGVAVTSMVRSLLVKSATLGKSASGEPLLAALFAETLAMVDPEIGEALAVSYWAGSDTGLQAAALQESDLVVVYGGEETVASVRGALPPGTRLVEHGPKLSLLMIGREALTRGAARRTAGAVAHAVATFDQQGCVSPQMAYLEGGGDTSPSEFAELLAEELHALERELPRGRVSTGEAAAIQQLRGAMEFRALGGGGVRVLASRGTEYTVILEESPNFMPSPLNRVIRLAPITDLAEAIEYLHPVQGYLQTVGLEAGPERRAGLAELLGRAGASRITTIEAMPWPPASWHHDGQEPIRELLRWVDLEG